LKNILITLAYNGKNYHGWQIQENALAVQEVFQQALYTILPDKPSIKGCSRTDTGVHAREFCVSLKTQSDVDEYRLMGSLNACLPFDIAVTACREVPMDFHARYSCVSKEYEYLIFNKPYRNPFYEGLALHYRRPLDVSLLNRAAGYFVGAHDFKAFCSAHSDKEDTVRQVYHAFVEAREDLVVFRVSANGFLYNMVRIMVGTLLKVNEGRIDADRIPYIIESKERNLAGQTAPAHGLYLNKVLYSQTT